eukprot:4313756-Pleurochrysis_carterae.AAC.9
MVSLGAYANVRNMLDYMLFAADLSARIHALDPGAFVLGAGGGVSRARRLVVLGALHVPVCDRCHVQELKQQMA